MKFYSIIISVALLTLVSCKETKYAVIYNANDVYKTKIDTNISDINVNFLWSKYLTIRYKHGQKKKIAIDSIWGAVTNTHIYRMKRGEGTLLLMDTVKKIYVYKEHLGKGSYKCYSEGVDGELKPFSDLKKILGDTIYKSIRDLDTSLIRVPSQPR